MVNSIVIGAICFAIIILVEKLAPTKTRWQKATLAALSAAIGVALWIHFSPI